MSRPADFDEPTRQHLQMIQAVISRLASNGFSLKGWSLTLTAAVLAFTASKNASGQTGLFVFAALVPIAFFWVLDAYYLMLERRYRRLYEVVRSQSAGSVAEGKGRVPLFLMGLSKDLEVTRRILKEESLPKAFCRPAVLAFHLPLLIGVLLSMVLLPG